MDPQKAGVGWPNVDLCWQDGSGKWWVAEVKSLTPQNEVHQMRLGLGQVLEFRTRVSEITGGEVSAALVVEREPSDATAWSEICSSADVVLTWPADFVKALKL